ncbi:hypothetical protein [Ensifer soli]|uniref:hypothetical protein n=1 Tax=Ciceribacter sp. sgz301302 TaxID=3342379 RepID=UPI0035B8B0DB
MTPYLSVILLVIINLGVIWLLIAIPLGHRTLTLSRRFPAGVERVWRAVDPAGPAGDWHHGTLESRRIEGAEDLVEQRFVQPDRHGAPTRRILRLSPVVVAGGHGYEATVVEDSALDIGFWRAFRERRTVTGDDTGATVTVEQTDRYKGLAVLILRYFALRRELRALEAWLAHGVSTPEPNGLERPAAQVALASVSTLLLWPFFGISVEGLTLSVLLTTVIVLHELGHLAAYRTFGHRSVRMLFIPFLGGVAIGGRPYHSRFEVATCALMGAGMSAFLVPATIALKHAVPQAALVALVFLIILGAFNLLNLLPMNRFDGGQVLAQVFETRSALVAASFAVTLAILAIGWRIGLSTQALLSGLAVFSLVSLMNRSGVKPRERLVDMSGFERVLCGLGLYAALGLHGYAIVYAADRLFSGG